MTLTTIESLELTAVPGAGSILTTVQFAGANTMVYFGFAEASVTLVSPRAVSLSSAIFAFCPVKSGIVIDPAVAVAVAGDTVVFHDGRLGADCVTVTVDGELEVVLPQAATVTATAQAAPANRTMLPITVTERITAERCCGPDSESNFLDAYPGRGSVARAHNAFRASCRNV